MRPFDILGAAKAAVHEMVFGQTARSRALPLQHGTHQAAVETGIVDIDVGDDLLADRAGHLHVVGWPEAAVGHLHDPRIGVRRGRAWLLRFFAVVALLFAFLAA